MQQVVKKKLIYHIKIRIGVELKNLCSFYYI